MSPMSEEMEEIQVDGQIIKIPAAGEWGEIVRQSTFMDAPVRLLGEEGMGSHLVTFATDHQGEFSIGLYQPGAMRSWIVLPLFRTDGSWQRVQIEHIACQCCSAQMVIANPAEPSLYFGVSNEIEVLRRASALQQVACPQCGGRLQRPAIWADLIIRAKANV